jgi:hypothetical protein
MTEPRHDRYPGYDVLDKRDTSSWNEQTRRAIDARLALPRHGRFFTGHEYATVEAIAARIVPQPSDRPPIPVAALVDAKLLAGEMDGYRQPGMPRDPEAWRRGLWALDAEAQRAHGSEFRRLRPGEQDALLRRMQRGELADAAWGGMPPASFFRQRLLTDVVRAYYAHPTAWSEIGFGGPASPRGYVRLGYDERDPWEAAEAKPGEEAAARRRNRHVG